MLILNLVRPIRVVNLNNSSWIKLSSLKLPNSDIITVNNVHCGQKCWQLGIPVISVFFFRRISRVQCQHLCWKLNTSSFLGSFRGLRREALACVDILLLGPRSGIHRNSARFYEQACSNHTKKHVNTIALDPWGYQEMIRNVTKYQRCICIKFKSRRIGFTVNEKRQ